MVYVKSLVIAGLLLASLPGFADGMRCGNKLVVTGDSKAEVLKKCGEPDFKETIKLLKKSKQVVVSGTGYDKGQQTKNIQSGVSLSSSKTKITNSGQSGISLTTETVEAVDQWTYNPGPNQFIKLLTFSGGYLQTVEDGERGYKTD